MQPFKCNAPLNLQFEVTYRCNNRCIFCYNEQQAGQPPEVDTKTAKKIITNIRDSGVLSLNFNGGEPLMRDDLLDIAEYAKNQGLDVHLNTNASLIDEALAVQISKIFPSVCTTILSGNNELHDELSGRYGAFSDALLGIQNLQKHSVYVSVNLMLCKKNLGCLEETFDFIRLSHIKTLLVTRYVPRNFPNDVLDISDVEFLNAIQCLDNYQKRYHCFDRIALPQPFQLCLVPASLRDKVRQWNIPCNVGLCTASISANGDITPCNLVKQPVLGNAAGQPFLYVWNNFEGERFCIESHLMQRCLDCVDLDKCGGGCKGYNSALKS